MKRRIGFAVAVVGFAMLTGGCGMEQDYVLREPLEVQLGDNRSPVELPAGTHVRRTFTKNGMAFVTVYGMTRQRALDNAGEPE